MSNNFPKKVLALVTPEKNLAIKRLLNQMAGNHNFEFVFVDTIESATAAIKDCPYGLFICEVTDKKSLVLALNTLKKNKKILSGNHIKVGSFNHFKNPQVEKGLKKVGVDDFFDIYINVKSFTFKLDFWFKTLKPLAVNNDEGAEDVKTFSKNGGSESAGDTELNAGAKGGSNKGEDGGKPSLARRKNEVVNVDPIQNENDMWLLEDPDDCKNLLRRWLVKLVGPSVNAGKWEQEVLNHNRTETVWKFVFNDPEMKEMFLNGAGSWCFDGGKPEFDWNEKKWVFTGASPSLFFEGESEDYDYRFKFDKGALLLAKNSFFAETKKDFIEQTFNDEKQFAADKKAEEEQKNIRNKNDQAVGNMKGDVNDQDKLGGHMEGAGSKDNEEGGHLEGAIGEQFHEGENLAGDVGDSSAIDGHMKGSAKNASGDVGGHMKGDSKNSGDVGGKMSGAAKGGDRSSGSMGGKSVYKEDAKSGMDAGVDGTDDLGPSHYGRENQYQESAKGNQKGRQSGTDDLGVNYYENHNEHERNEDGTPRDPNLIGRKIEKEQGVNFDPNDMIGKKAGEDQDQDSPNVNYNQQNKKHHEEDLDSDYLANHKKNLQDIAASDSDELSEMYTNQSNAKKAEIEARKKANEANGKMFDFEADKKWKKNERQSKMDEMEDILSDKKYNESDAQYKEDENGRAVSEKTARGYDFETESANNVKDLPNYERGEDELEVDEADFQFERAFTDEELEQMIANSDLKIVIEKPGVENSKRVVGFEDLYDAEIVLSVEKGYAEVEEKVNVFLLVKYLNEKVSMTLEGTVLEVEDLDDPESETQTVIIDVHNFNADKVDKFMKIYFKRQENIQKFIGFTKGVA